jgi:lipid-A-disaccharide synthase
MKRLYIIAGEASGDLHGGNLVHELFKVSGDRLEVRAWGGDRMAAAGAEVVKHYRELAFMGFTQVVMNLRTILRNLENCKKDIEAFKRQGRR